MEKIPTEEYSWLLQHPEVEEKYVEQWIAISGKKVVAHSRDLQEVLDQTSHLQPLPHITFVEQEVLAAYALHLLISPFQNHPDRYFLNRVE